MNFKEAASKYLRETYDIEGFEFTQDDPLSVRAEFIHAIDDKVPLAYMFDDGVPEILLTGISGFEESMEDPKSLTQVLMAPALLNISRDPFKSLPELIPPFSTEVFKGKDPTFTVNMGDLIEETDDQEWADNLKDNFNYWLAKRTEFLTEQIFPIALELEEQYPGIVLGLIKSSFVTSFYDITKDDDGTFDVDDLWDIFGWTLDLWGDWDPDRTTKKDEIEVKVINSNKESTSRWDDDYNEEYFQNVE
jgi:hypothetical protein